MKTITTKEGNYALVIQTYDEHCMLLQALDWAISDHLAKGGKASRQAKRIRNCIDGSFSTGCPECGCRNCCGDEA